MVMGKALGGDDLGVYWTDWVSEKRLFQNYPTETPFFSSLRLDNWMTMG